MDLREFLIECVFPTQCVSCDKSGEWWCASCREASGYALKNLPIDAPLDGLAAVGFYHAKPLREMLQALKYHGVTKVTPSIREYIKGWKDARLDPWPWAGYESVCVQALPAAPNRVRERGFDQAELLADIFCEELFFVNQKYFLQRISTGTSQASLPHGELRDANIRGSFSCIATNIPKTIILVDDVVTSGSSMREAARVLKAAGAEKVFGIALAVGA